jgi:inorganic pyrophosphatase
MQVEFWNVLDQLLAACPLVIDRPKGTCHPRYPELIYPLDYGYLQGSTTIDGGGLDAWRGSLPEGALTALALTVDLHKRDAEIKLLLGCTEDEQQTILAFHNDGLQRATLIRRPNSTQNISSS